MYHLQQETACVLPFFGEQSPQRPERHLILVTVWWRSFAYVIIVRDDTAQSVGFGVLNVTAKNPQRLRIVEGGISVSCQYQEWP